jgi:hypothetical protein
MKAELFTTATYISQRNIIKDLSLDDDKFLGYSAE